MSANLKSKKILKTTVLFTFNNKGKNPLRGTDPTITTVTITSMQVSPGLAGKLY